MVDLAAELGGEEKGDVFCELGILGAGVGGGLGPIAGVIEEIAAGGPFLVGGAGFPGGEVFEGDGLVIKVAGDDGFDGGEGVEPVENALGWLGVEEAFVEPSADLRREAGDLAGAAAVVAATWGGGRWRRGVR